MSKKNKFFGIFSNKVNTLILFGLVLLSLAISIWGIILFNSKVDCQQLEFSYDKLGTIVGIILSAFSLVVALFFIVLGIRADDIRKEIKSDAKESEELITGLIRQYHGRADDLSKKIGEFETIIYNLYSETIGMNKMSLDSVGLQKGCMIMNGANCRHVERLKEEMSGNLTKLKLAQARFVCQACFLDKDIRETGINTLVALSTDKTDLKLLEELFYDLDVKETALDAWKRLSNKLNVQV